MLTNLLRNQLFLHFDRALAAFGLGMSSSSNTNNPSVINNSNYNSQQGAGNQQRRGGGGLVRRSSDPFYYYQQQPQAGPATSTQSTGKELHNFFKGLCN